MLNLPQPGGEAVTPPVVTLNTPPPWWQLPAGFVPGAPFHPALRIVTEQQVLTRVAGLTVRGQTEAAKDLAYALIKARLYPQLAPKREALKLDLIQLGSALTGNEGKATA